MGIGAILGGASAIGGLISGNRNARAANRLSRESLQIQREYLDLTKQRLAQWQNLYGGIEKNLSDFYTYLSVDEFRSRGLEAYQTEFQKQRDQLTETFAQIGYDSGVQADVFAKQDIQSAEAKSKISRDAPFQLAEAKQNFLQLGMGRRAEIEGSQQNAATNVSTILSNQSNQAAASADAGFNAAASGFQAIIDDYEFEQRNKPSANQGAPGFRD